MAQLFAGRTDLLAPAYARALTTLTDQVPQVPLAEIVRVIREEYGATPAELFERFDEVPIAAASLGQVHRARLAGEEVVIKVLRPGVEALVAEDVRVSQRLVALVERWWPNPHVVGTRVVIQEFASRVTEEMDFRQEAAHAVAIRANFAGSRSHLDPACRRADDPASRASCWSTVRAVAWTGWTNGSPRDACDPTAWCAR